MTENPPGRDTLLYRVGDFATFREALLRPLSDQEQALAGWRPSARGDLTLQLLEWWAYLADILTFYNERIAHDAYLRTAVSPGAVERLVRLLGYRPRPGLGAMGVLAGLSNSRTPVTLPRGLAFQSRPAPGKPPQLFELDEDTRLEPSGSRAVEAAYATDLSGGHQLLLRGSVPSVRAGDQVLLVSKEWNLAEDPGRGYAAMTVRKVALERDVRGRPVTRVLFERALPETLRRVGSSQAFATDYRVLKAGQSARLFPDGSAAPDGTTVRLESVFRGAQPGEQVLLMSSRGEPTLTRVSQYAEQLGYTHAVDLTRQSVAAPMAIPHTQLTLESAASDTAQVHFGWREVGEPIDESPTSVQGPELNLSLEGPIPLPKGATSRLVFLEDSTGQGLKGRATPSSEPLRVRVSELDPNTPLIPPLRLLYNLLPVSRGATVAREVLGSGDSSLAAQRFQLQKSPLTYLPEGAGHRSTLRLWVDGIEWKEVPSFFGQPPDARVFVTREDEEQRTTLFFGEGVHGARLPTGVENVVATYRYGSDAGAPEAGALSVLVRPYPGLQSVRNPVAVTGGTVPEPAAKLRQLAPRSVLTLGRAISASDYAALALDAPHVERARAYWSFDAEQQRPLLRLYVGDTLEARQSARAALRAVSDPQRRVEVLLAWRKPIQLSLEVLADPRFLPESVDQGVRRALMDPETGLFGVKRARIGATVYDSQIHEACLRVPGTRAVHHLRFEQGDVPEEGPNHSPGEGGFYVLEEDMLSLVITEAVTHA